MTLEIFLSIAGFVALLVTGTWALLRIVVAQFERRLDDRFAAMDASRNEGRKVYDERFHHMEMTLENLGNTLVKMQLDLPREYVRREDHIMFETVINAKLDSVAAKMDLLAEIRRRE